MMVEWGLGEGSALRGLCPGGVGVETWRLRHPGTPAGRLLCKGRVGGVRVGSGGGVKGFMLRTQSRLHEGEGEDRHVAWCESRVRW